MNSWLKRAAVAAAAGALCLSMAACGSSSSGSTDGTTSSSPESTASGSADAGLAEAQAEVARLEGNPPLDLTPLSKPVAKGLKAAAVNCNLPACKPGEFVKTTQALGWEGSEELYDLAKGPADFVAAVRRALQAKPSALAILFVFPPDVVKKELAQAQADGVTLVDIGSAIDAPPPGFIACVACNPGLKVWGNAQASLVLADAGAATSLGIVGDKTTSANIVTGQALTDELARMSPDTKVTKIEASYTKTPQENAQTIVAALQRDPSIKYLMFQGPDFMVGVEQALNAAGLTDQVKMIGIDPSNQEQLDQIKGGGVYAWIGGDAPVIWWRATDALARASVGDAVDATPVPTLRIITKENVKPDMYAPTDYEAAFKTAWGVA